MTSEGSDGMMIPRVGRLSEWALGLLAPRLLVGLHELNVRLTRAVEVVVVLVHDDPADARRVCLLVREHGVHRVDGGPTGPTRVDRVRRGEHALADQRLLVLEALAAHHVFSE